MFDRFKCTMSGASLRLDGSDQLRRDSLSARIVERSSGNIPQHQPIHGDFERTPKPRCFELFLQTR
jgi:hypothetical protein